VLEIPNFILFGSTIYFSKCNVTIIQFLRPQAKMTTTESKAVTGGSDGEFPKSKGFKNVGTAPEFSSFDERERSIASNDVVFDATEDVRHYKPIDTYEGIHRWDPDFEWEREEEEKIVKKVTAG
jgi:hypothetical protein